MTDGFEPMTHEQAWALNQRCHAEANATGQPVSYRATDCVLVTVYPDRRPSVGDAIADWLTEWGGIVLSGLSVALSFAAVALATKAEGWW